MRTAAELRASGALGEKRAGGLVVLAVYFMISGELQFAISCAPACPNA
jgi:hypothetical protein